MEIKKKVWPQYFELIKSGKKKFEVRVADFEVKEGDTLILEEWDPETKEYIGRTLTKRAGYTLKFTLDSFGQKELIEEKGLVVISLEES